MVYKHHAYIVLILTRTHIQSTDLIIIYVASDYPQKYVFNPLTVKSNQD